MQITYNVPKGLEDKFRNKSQQEIEDIITQALYSSGMEIVQNMCLDIIAQLQTIKTVQTQATPIKEAERPKDVQMQKEEVQEKPKRKIDTKLKNKKARRFANSIFK